MGGEGMGDEGKVNTNWGRKGKRRYLDNCCSCSFDDKYATFNLQSSPQQSSPPTSYTFSAHSLAPSRNPQPRRGALPKLEATLVGVTRLALVPVPSCP